MLKTRVQYLQPTQKSKRLRELLHNAVDTRQADLLLLSGGIDSGALAACAPTIPAYTMSLRGASERLDLRFARKVVKHLKLDWNPVVVTHEEALSNLKFVIRINESYDVALLNDLALYTAINRATVDFGTKSLTVRSGEPADIPFRGYFVTYELDQLRLNAYIDRTSAVTLPLAKLEQKTQIKTDYPYLDQKVIEFAKNISRDDTLILRAVPGDIWSTHKENPGKLITPPYPFGKLVLRQAMFAELPEEITIRSKTDIQFGSGTDTLKIALKATSAERASYEEEGLSFRDNVHAGMYKLYKNERLSPRRTIYGQEEECASCHGPVLKDAGYCMTCGSEHPNASFDEVRRLRRL